MEVKVAMQEPWAWVVGPEANAERIGGVSTAGNDVTTRRIDQVEATTCCRLNDVEGMTTFER